MKTVTLRAHFDGEQIQLDDPFPLVPETPLSVVVWPREEEVDEEYEDWALLSKRCLESSFGEDEPEYSLDLIKDPNPAYERG
jgi:hypothetical protein